MREYLKLGLSEDGDQTFSGALNHFCSKIKSRRANVCVCVAFPPTLVEDRVPAPFPAVMLQADEMRMDGLVPYN